MNRTAMYRNKRKFTVMAKVSVSEAFPSKWLASSDLDGEEIVATLANDPLDYQDFKQQGKETPDRKPVLYFRCPRGAKPLKPMVLNKINFTTLIDLLGEETDEWAGQQITIGADWVEAFGKRTLGLRIRPELPKPTPTVTKSTQRSRPQPETEPTDTADDAELF